MTEQKEENMEVQNGNTQIHRSIHLGSLAIRIITASLAGTVETHSLGTGCKQLADIGYSEGVIKTMLAPDRLYKHSLLYHLAGILQTVAILVVRGTRKGKSLA